MGPFPFAGLHCWIVIASAVIGVSLFRPAVNGTVGGEEGRPIPRVVFKYAYCAEGVTGQSLLSFDVLRRSRYQGGAVRAHGRQGAFNVNYVRGLREAANVLRAIVDRRSSRAVNGLQLRVLRGEVFAVNASSRRRLVVDGVFRRRVRVFKDDLGINVRVPCVCQLYVISAYFRDDAWSKVFYWVRVGRVLIAYTCLRGALLAIIAQAIVRGRRANHAGEFKWGLSRFLFREMSVIFFIMCEGGSDRLVVSHFVRYLVMGVPRGCGGCRVG